MRTERSNEFDDLAVLPQHTSDRLGLSDGCPDLTVMSWRSDLRGAREWLSPAWGAFTGRPPRPDGKDADWTDCAHAEDRERCRAIFRTCAASGAPFSMDYRLLRMDGTYRWVMDSGVPQHEDGELVGYVGSCVDVHARRLSGDRLAERTRALRLHERSRESQLTALALDLHGPLALIADAERLIDQRLNGASADSLRALLKRAHRQLTESLDRLEALGPERLCAGAALVPVVAVMKAAVSHVDAAMTQSRSSLAIDMPEPDMLLYADAIQLGRAVASVVEQVCDSWTRPGKVGVTIRHDDHAVYLRIRPSTEAMEPEFVPRAFELARRSGTKRVAAATESCPLSARLELARRILQLHCGELFSMRAAGEQPTEWVMRVPLQR